MSAEAGVKELKSRDGTWLECGALDGIVKIISMLLFDNKNRVRPKI